MPTASVILTVALVEPAVNMPEEEPTDPPPDITAKVYGAVPPEPVKVWVLPGEVVNSVTEVGLIAKGTDGVFVGVLVGVLEGVAVGVLVGVLVGVAVGVLVAVTVGVGVKVGQFPVLDVMVPPAAEHEASTFVMHVASEQNEYVGIGPQT